MEELSTTFADLLANGQLETATIAATATIVVLALRKLPGKVFVIVKKILIAVGEKLKG